MLFREIIEALLGEYQGDISIEKDIETLSDEELFKKIISQILQQGRKASGVTTTLDKIEKDPAFKGWRPETFCSDSGKDILKKYVDKTGKTPKTRLILESAKQISKIGVKEWVNALKDGKAYIGKKSRDDFLKERGFFEFIPIDRYYPPFLAKTGLLFYYAKKKPKTNMAILLLGLGREGYNGYRQMMLDMIGDELKGLKLKGLYLSENPGLVDKLIWRHCAKKPYAKEICTNTDPHCGICKLNHLCLFAKSQL
ncbi:MAG: hypothetical protein V1676_00920 [Candidatus Diapherotrites archaeon]